MNAIYYVRDCLQSPTGYAIIYESTSNMRQSVGTKFHSEENGLIPASGCLCRTDVRTVYMIAEPRNIYGATDRLRRKKFSMTVRTEALNKYYCRVTTESVRALTR